MIGQPALDAAVLEIVKSDNATAADSVDQEENHTDGEENPSNVDGESAYTTETEGYGDKSDY